MPPIFIVPRVPQLNAIGIYFNIPRKEFQELKYKQILKKGVVDIEKLIKSATK